MPNIDEMMKKTGEKMNEARDAVLDLADKAGKKISELYGDARVRLKIAEVQKDINSLYKDIGKAAYTANRSGEDVSAVINEKCDEIQRLYAEMEELSRSLEKEQEQEGSDGGDVIEVEAAEAPEAPAPESPAQEAPVQETPAQEAAPAEAAPEN